MDNGDSGYNLNVKPENRGLIRREHYVPATIKACIEYTITNPLSNHCVIWVLHYAKEDYLSMNRPTEVWFSLFHHSDNSNERLQYSMASTSWQLLHTQNIRPSMCTNNRTYAETLDFQCGFLISSSAYMYTSSNAYKQNDLYTVVIH